MSITRELGAAAPRLVPVQARALRASAVPTRESRRRDRALAQELLVRSAVALAMIGFNELFTVGDHARNVIRVASVIGLIINGPYYLLARTGRSLRAQAHTRMSLDVVLLTAGLYAAGGLAAAPYAAVYAIVPVYTGIVFSSRACLVVTALATVSFLGMAVAQTVGLLPESRPIPADAWETATFNLLVLNIVGGLAALLARAYRLSRHRLAAAHAELERAHDESLRLNEHIQRAARLESLGEVVAGVTHEIRNVLTGALGHVWLLRERVAAPSPDIERHLSQIERCCDDAMRIIRRTLDMARQPGAEPEPVVIAEVIERVSELKRYDLRRYGITLRVDVVQPLPVIAGSAFQLQQVLLNLVTNAQDELRRSEAPREIAITATAGTEGCVIEVADTGRGIPYDALPRLFEPFFTTKEDGTGLGLAISAGIVERFGGRLTAANRRDGGAVFRVTLPVTR
jgi:signal transduction histidine kinase